MAANAASIVMEEHILPDMEGEAHWGRAGAHGKVLFLSSLSHHLPRTLKNLSSASLNFSQASIFCKSNLQVQPRLKFG
jgi:hypothetical protein